MREKKRENGSGGCCAFHEAHHSAPDRFASPSTGMRGTWEWSDWATALTKIIVRKLGRRTAKNLLKLSKALLIKLRSHLNVPDRPKLRLTISDDPGYDFRRIIRRHQ